MSGMGGFKFPGGGTGGAPPPSSGNAKVSKLNIKEFESSMSDSLQYPFNLYLLSHFCTETWIENMDIWTMLKYTKLLRVPVLIGHANLSRSLMGHLILHLLSDYGSFLLNSKC